ncbi:hypothetical protein Pmani_024134 [Petrolisthes manimaculis]|uniref:Major facilitator superfamily associated domain-containing protein n=1 Tax=Petrolisthes manimaculis TaxID=1843537 RepID=A0AAE1P8U4_9EUCA|nr:hypothetical protein Pmani_024134 [Petrolisthes manimaculis]
MLMGLTVAVGGLAGVPILVAAESIITRLGHANTIVISTAFYVLRFVGYSFITSPWWCMPLETLECMTVALLMTTAVSYAAELATPATLATLQGVNGGVHYGVAGKPSNYRSRPHLRAVDGSLTFMPNVRGKVRADPLTALSIGRSSHHVHT